jgi:hypothetical protein
MSAIDAYSQNEATPGNSRTASEEARAVLWTGIIGAAKHIGKREPLNAARRPLVVQLKQGVGTAPVYFIGAGLFEFHLAQLISSEQSVHAVEIAWPSEWQYPSWYSAAWKSLRETWRRASQTDTPQSLAAKLANSWSVGWWSLFEVAKLAKQKLLVTVLADQGKLTTKLDSLGRPLHWQLIERLYANSLRNYQLRKLSAHGVIFRADRAEDCPTPAPDHALGWSALFGDGLNVVQMTGGHKTMIQQSPHDLRLASEMTHALDQSYARLNKADGNGAA